MGGEGKEIGKDLKRLLKEGGGDNENTLRNAGVGDGAFLRRTGPFWTKPRRVRQPFLPPAAADPSPNLCPHTAHLVFIPWAP